MHSCRHVADHVRSQSPLPTVAASITYGCSLHPLRLQEYASTADRKLGNDMLARAAAAHIKVMEMLLAQGSALHGALQCITWCIT